jgi:hypothetical protein
MAISAFKHIRLSGQNLIPTFDSNSNTLRLSLGGTGLAYYNELTGLSGHLRGLINTADDDVTRINGLSGAVTITGGAGVSIGINSTTNTITISGADSGYFQGLVNTLTTNLFTTGSTLDTKINTLSGYVTGANSTFTTNLASTGSTLTNSITSLSGLFTGFTGALDNTFASDSQLFTTGSTLDTKINTLSGYVTGADATLTTNLASTGSTLNIKVDNLSGFVTGTFVRKLNQQVFNTNIPLGVESTGILFPLAFSSIPSTVNVTLETAGDVMYMVGVRSRSTTGYFADFSDIVQENTVKLNTFASNQ